MWMPFEEGHDSVATVIIGERVRPGCEEAFRAWEHALNKGGSLYRGFIAAEINPPTPVQPQWSLIYRFDSVPNLQAWINSATRQERLAEGMRYLDGPSTQHVVTGGASAPDTLVTTRVTQRVPPEDVAEYLSC